MNFRQSPLYRICPETTRTQKTNFDLRRICPENAVALRQNLITAGNVDLRCTQTQKTPDFHEPSNDLRTPPRICPEFRRSSMMTAGDDLLCTSRGDVCSRIEKLRLLRFQEPSKRPLNHGCETPHRRRSVLRPPSLTASDRVCLGPAVKKKIAPSSAQKLRRRRDIREHEPAQICPELPPTTVKR